MFFARLEDGKEKGSRYPLPRDDVKKRAGSCRARGKKNSVTQKRKGCTFSGRKKKTGVLWEGMM